MVIVLKKDISESDKDNLREFLTSKNFKLNEVVGEEETIFAAVGKVHMNIEELETKPGVMRVIPISKPYKQASREFKKDDTIVEIANNRGQIIRVGGKRLVAIAGPCAVESRDQLMSVAEKVAASGASMLRGRAYKPRTSPYAYQGMGEEGLKCLREAGDRFGLPVVSEIVSGELIPLMTDYVDVFQIGSRNMQDFDLLKKVGATGKPVILKRGYTATLEEFLMSAEYLLASGTENVILCERGIRTFEHSTRNTLDLSAIPVLRKLTHLPIIVDPSHALGQRDLVPPMGLAAIASGADGIMVDVHDNPEKALAGGAASLVPAQFDKLMHDIEALAPVMGKAVAHIREEKHEKVVCAYSGKRGAYAEQAISRYFDTKDVSPYSVNSFSEIFQSVLDGKADYGIVPIENSLAGSVYQNYDNFMRFQDVTIVGAITLNIRHALLGIKGASISDIKTVYSHPQGFSQCKNFLDAHPDWIHIDAISTASAAQIVEAKKDKSIAAIASTVNSGIYNLDVLQEDIENDPSNFTRFVIIQSRANADGKTGEVNIRPNMASIIFKTKNEVGALYKTLGIFNQHKINLTRLESRPLEGQPWNYWFYVDTSLENINGSPKEYVAAVIDALKNEVEDVRLLGVYPENRH
ncbi:MAG: 3-deoxy-7-phosphoheptulonate synthase [Treponema sp.]|nr:3-deoxy-7-phosphoheptulonate synthase [Treponema sp.]